MARYIDADNLIEHLEDMIAECYTPDVDTQPIAYGSLLGLKYALSLVEALPTANVVEVETISEQIIRKKAEVSDYWQNDVKQYRARKGYSDIEHDVDNFLRGYNEAVEDMLAILDERKVTSDGNTVDK